MALFTQHQAALLSQSKPIQHLKLRPLMGRQVYLGESQDSRFLAEVHFDKTKNCSFLCHSGKCIFCAMGWRKRPYLYLAVNEMGTGHHFIACVSSDVASAWLTKSPDFRNVFRLERPLEQNKGVRCVEILTHGNLKTPWQGFDVRAQVVCQDMVKFARHYPPGYSEDEIS